jgi:tRNA(fMet)-specific endonuclease VapC
MRQLDTNIVIAYFNGNAHVAAQIKAYLPDVAISVLVFGELMYGARASARAQENLDRLHEFVQLVSVVDFDQASAESYSYLRLQLRRKGRPTGEADALIAATTLAHNAILVTHNVKHFEHISGLVIEDWLVQPQVKK